MKTEVLRCQGCGANLPFDGTEWTITCKFCGTPNTVVLDDASRERTQKMKQAAIFMERKRYEDAENCYMDVIEKFPSDSDAWFGLLGAYTWGFSRKCTDYKTTYDCEILNRYVYNMTLYNEHDDDRLEKATDYLCDVGESAQKEIRYRISIDDTSIRGTTGPEAIQYELLNDILHHCSESLIHIDLCYGDTSHIMQ